MVDPTNGTPLAQHAISEPGGYPILLGEGGIVTRKLYELEMTDAEVNYLIEVIQRGDRGSFLTVLAQELQAQRDQKKVGMTDILDSYPQQTKRTDSGLTELHDKVASVVAYLDESNNVWKEFCHEGEHYIVKVNGKTTLRRYHGYKINR